MQSPRDTAKEIVEYIKNMEVFPQVKEMVARNGGFQDSDTDRREQTIENMAITVILARVVTETLAFRAQSSETPQEGEVMLGITGEECPSCKAHSKLNAFTSQVICQVADRLREDQLLMCAGGILELAQGLEEREQVSDETLH